MNHKPNERESKNKENLFETRMRNQVWKWKKSPKEQGDVEQLKGIDNVNAC